VPTKEFSVTNDLDYVIRLRPDQANEIEKAKQVRAAASELRDLVSIGQYGEVELRRFWQIVEAAQRNLMASSTQLAHRAGLGRQFFSSVARDRRSPKLPNFLKALTAIIDVADEHLHDVERMSSFGATPASSAGLSRIASDHVQLRMLAVSLARLARSEIEKIDSERPNHPATIESNKRQRELLLLFADGFDRIAGALAGLERTPNEPLLLGKAKAVVDNVGARVSEWWEKNATEVIDWSVRLPVFAAGVTMLGWAGANMTVATSAVATIVGVKKVVGAIRDKKKRS
jgi:hypothetical protein